jgi:hypothetical protein
MAAYFIVQIINGLASDVVLFTPLSNWVSQGFNSFAGPLALLWAAWKIAPKGKFVTVLCLTVGHAMLAASLFVWVYSKPVKTAQPLWWLLLCSVISIVTTVLFCATCYRVPEDQDALIEDSRVSR